MKKYLLSLVLSSISVFCLAQNSSRPAPKDLHTPFQFGVYAGVNTGAPIPKTVTEGSKGDLGTNFRGGFMTKYKFSKKFGLLVECGYAHKTATFSSPVKDQYIEQTFQIPDGVGGFITGRVETTFSGNTKGSFDLHYLESALLAEYNVSRNLSVAVGAFGADLVRGKNAGIATEVQIGTVPGYFDDQPFDNSAELNRFDYGLVGGLGYKLVDNLQLNMRLAWGSPSIYIPTFTRVPEPLPTRYLQVGMDYRIGERL